MNIIFLKFQKKGTNKMFGIIIFLLIFAIAIFISRNNLKNRREELKTNLIEFNNEIRHIFYSVSEDNQKKFLNLLNSQWRVNLESIVNNNFNYANSIWALQNQITQQQELFTELKKFINQNIK